MATSWCFVVNRSLSVLRKWPLVSHLSYLSSTCHKWTLTVKHWTSIRKGEGAGGGPAFVRTSEQSDSPLGLHRWEQIQTN